ncbi:fructosamine kinase family protein [Roseiconus nitratireducens]|uniref:Fructosamine kinase family protein n=1 Tax=Roseiconus nitratireducens TaxID=2605748 RepID=A0A5M6DHI1_9BACT|nr:fructosamine kinase family protein [Roseiconus nitratireducens]KAA5546913.1 fructosamine kinase family protein [Roseiconus nitratireducens]
MIANALHSLLGVAVDVTATRPLGGGCISEVMVASIAPGDASSWQQLEHVHHGQSKTELLVKRHERAMASNFRCEADGLLALAEAGAIRIPKVYATGVVDDSAYLVTEFVRSDSAASRSRTAGQSVFATFGRQLADLHRATAGDRIGWTEDNFLGSAPQPNGGCQTWASFVAERRIGFQTRWATDQGLLDPALRSACDRIVEKMDALLAGGEDRTSLLHGDLWSGNYLFDADGNPVLIDPAVYHGSREAEWGMLRWMGGCPPEFEQAYLDQWPLPDGWRRRVLVYELYHQLNHLNLFGRSYASACRRTVGEILG